MKEEIFLFYREYLRPHIEIIHSYFRHYFRALPLIHHFFSTKNPEIKYKFWAMNEEDLRNNLNQGVNAALFPSEEINDLDRNTYHILCGAYDDVTFFLNYLRERGFKVLWRQSVVETNNNKPMWRRRVAVIEAIYADLITEKIKNRDFLMDEKNEWIDFEREIFKTYQEHKEEYKTLIEGHLRDDWDLSRINPMTVSIILEAIAEYQILKTDKLILITQSVKTAKNYCEDQDYKIINAILDNHFKSKN